MTLPRTAAAAVLLVTLALGCAKQPVDVLKELDTIEVANEQDLPKMKPYFTSRGYTVFCATVRLVGFDASSPLQTYGSQTIQGDVADVTTTSSAGETGVFRLIRENGTWKVDDFYSNGQWLSKNWLVRWAQDENS